jgi:hypothetical protein
VKRLTITRWPGEESLIPMVQKAWDAVRVIGKEDVHPGAEPLVIAPEASVSDDMHQKPPRSPVIKCRYRILWSDTRSFPPQSLLEPFPAIHAWKALR